MKHLHFLRSRIEWELERDRRDLRGILELPDDSARVDRLQELAVTLGASTIKAHPGYGYADQPELVHNIHVALQTKAMLAAVHTSSNYVIVTVILALIALAGAVASWIAALRFR